MVGDVLIKTNSRGNREMFLGLYELHGASDVGDGRKLEEAVAAQHQRRGQAARAGGRRVRGQLRRRQT